jgi:hypothetical protein
MTRREHRRHDRPDKSMIVIHDGVCGSPYSYACYENKELAWILMPFCIRFGLLDVCECGCFIWGAIVERESVKRLVATIGEELSVAGYEIAEAETDI